MASLARRTSGPAHQPAAHVGAVEGPGLASSGPGEELGLASALGAAEREALAQQVLARRGEPRRPEAPECRNVQGRKHADVPHSRHGLRLLMLLVPAPGVAGRVRYEREALMAPGLLAASAVPRTRRAACRLRGSHGDVGETGVRLPRSSPTLENGLRVISSSTVPSSPCMKSCSVAAAPSCTYA